MEVKIHPSWKKALQSEFDKPYVKELTDFVKSEYQSKTIYPHPKNIFSAMDLCPLDNVKVVILGQDPYHGPNQANGLCFSVNPGIPFPPSLLNIFKELINDNQLPKRPESGDLNSWAKQGILLLNATLTVQKKQAGSHQNKGWEKLTNAAIKAVSDTQSAVVFLLWGKYAQAKTELIDPQKHLILRAPHPSPLSAHRGFFGCQHFSKTNNYLEKNELETIKWDSILT